MPIIGDLSAPIIPPGDRPDPQVFTDWGGLTVKYTGWDGSVWDLTGYTDGVALVKGGVRGLTMPPISRFTTTSPAVPGSRYTGHQVTEREVFWPIGIYTNAGSQAWIEIERAWWKTMRPDKRGTWSVTDRLGNTRKLDIRFLDDGDQSFDTDPTMARWVDYGIHFIAEQPYWYGPGVSRSWGTPTPQDFFSTDPANVFYISDGSSVDTATMTNPGDVDTWMKWTVTGPVNGGVLGTANGSVAFTFGLAANATLTVDTRPDQMTAYDSTGADRSGDVIWAPASLPPGEEQTLAVTLTSPGAGAGVVGSLQDLYYRAWG